MGLDQKQSEELQKLPDRTFAFQSVEEGEPKLIRIPEIQRPRINLLELEMRSREWLARVPYVPFDINELKEKRTTASLPKPEPITDFRKDILRDLLEDPFISQRDRCQKFGKSQEEMAKIMKGLEQNRLIVRQSFGLGRGAPKEGALLTESALKWLGAKHNVPGRGSLQARYITHRLKQEVFPNSFIETEKCDLTVYDDGKGAVEVELEGSKGEHFLVNIQRDITSGFDWVIVLCMTDKAVKRMEKIAKEQLSADLLKKVEFKTVSEVLRNG